tara:strand:+ start:1713 stop:2072 length:360 start_codon:yes stop_codon:yes gene_type:complete
MKLTKRFSKLCTPAMLYFVLSMIAFLMMAFQNMSGDHHKYCLGTYSCQVDNMPGIFIFKLIYILFFTFVLDLICKAGYSGISWFLVLLPFILLFVLLGIMIITRRSIVDEMTYQQVLVA